MKISVFLKLSKPPTYLQYFQGMCSPNQSEYIFSINSLEN